MAEVLEPRTNKKKFAIQKLVVAIEFMYRMW